MTNNNKSSLYLSFGGLKTPSYWESISALYIVIIGFQIKDPFYSLIFIINGLSACLAHSPYIYKHYPMLRKFSSYIDGVSIYYVLMLYVFPIKKYYPFFTLLLLDLLFNKQLYKFTLKYRFLFVLPSVVKAVYRGILYKAPWSIIIAFVSKCIEEKYISKSLKIKYHTIWHIFDTHMFKSMVTL